MCITPCINAYINILCKQLLKLTHFKTAQVAIHYLYKSADVDGSVKPSAQFTLAALLRLSNY